MESTPIFDILLSSWETKEKALKYTYKRLKILDILSIICSFIGLILSQVETNFYYEQIERMKDEVIQGRTFYNIIYFEEEDENYENFVYRVIILASTCFLCYLLILRANTYLFYLKITNRIEIGATFYSSGILLTLILEIMFNFLISFPKNNYIFSETQEGYPLDYNLDQIMSLFQLGRVYILVRMWTQYSKWNKDTSIMICNLCNTDGGVRFAMKAEFKNSPFLVVGTLLSLTIFLMGFAVRTSERSYSYMSEIDWDYAWNGMWMIIIIISTVGYGDFYPRTYLGRFFVFFTCCFGPFFTSLINVSISNYVFFTREEMKAYEKIEQIEDYATLRHYASNCIKLSIKYWGHINLKFKSARSSSAHQKFSQIYNKYKEIFLLFHNKRLKVNSSGFNKPFDEALTIFSKNKDEDISNMLEEVSNLTSKINCRMEKINANSDIIEFKMKQIAYRYDLMKLDLGKNPIHSVPFKRFCNTFSYSPDSSKYLSYRQFSSDSIKEISMKENAIESYDSCNSLQTPLTVSAQKNRRAKQNEKILEISDIVRQLNKKVNRNDTKGEKDEEIQSSKIKSQKIRSPHKKSTLSSFHKKTDGLEIIKEDEENKDNVVNPLGESQKKMQNESEKMIFERKKFRNATFKESSKSSLKDENDEEIIEDGKKTSNHIAPLYHKVKTSPKIRKIPSRYTNERLANKEINNEESNFSMNFSSQMSGNVPFNMSVNVNAKPVFNLVTNMNTEEYPLIINCEHKKSENEKSPFYPEIKNLIEDGEKSKNSSFKEEEPQEHKENSQENSNILFRQRKIVIEHSMLITESYIPMNKEIPKTVGVPTKISPFSKENSPFHQSIIEKGPALKETEQNN